MLLKILREGVFSLQKVDKTVKHETIYIAITVLIMSVLLQAVFLIIGKWDYTVLSGNLLSGIVAIANFFLMGLTVQKAISQDEDQSVNMMKLSQLLRMIMLLLTTILGVTLPYFNLCAIIVPLFFPRIAVSFRPLFDKQKSE